MLRTPIVSDRFYPGSHQECLTALDHCLSDRAENRELPAVILGGIAPHAGWMCSGKVAGKVFSSAVGSECDTVVLFGAVHRAALSKAAVHPSGAWRTPIGDMVVDSELAEQVARRSVLVESNVTAHRDEHSIEVQMPFIKRLFPTTKVLTVMVPPSTHAPEVGRVVVDAARAMKRRIIAFGTTDLTHYGPAYRFEPHGPGAVGRRWAKEINDRRIIDLMLQMDAESVVPEAAAHRNACGAGAVAATITACQALRADRAVLLEHATSHEILGSAGGDNAVGYAAVVFGTNTLN